METLISLFVIAGIAGFFYFRKKDKKKRNISIAVGLVSFILFGIFFGDNEPNKADSDNEIVDVEEVDEEVEEEADEEVEEEVDEEVVDEAADDDKVVVEEKKKERKEEEDIEITERDELSNLDELQELYLKLNDVTKEEVLKEINESELAFNEKEFSSGPSIKVALTDGQAKHRYADSGSHTKISFNKDLEIEVVEYYSNTKNLTLIDYRKGTYWDLRDQPEYAGYYINKPGGSLGSFTVKYSNGNEADTGYLKVNSKEEQLNYLNKY